LQKKENAKLSCWLQKRMVQFRVQTSRKQSQKPKAETIMKKQHKRKKTEEEKQMGKRRRVVAVGGGEGVGGGGGGGGGELGGKQTK